MCGSIGPISRTDISKPSFQPNHQLSCEPLPQTAARPAPHLGVFEGGQPGTGVREQVVAAEDGDLVAERHVLQRVAVGEVGGREVDDALVDQVRRVDHLGDLGQRALTAAGGGRGGAEGGSYETPCGVMNTAASVQQTVRITDSWFAASHRHRQNG